MFFRKLLHEIFCVPYNAMSIGKGGFYRNLKYKVLKNIFFDNIFKLNLTPIEKKRLYSNCLSFIGTNWIEGDYYEFGTFEGTSFIDTYKGIQEKIENPNSKNKGLRMHMYGFDSFEGLPEITTLDKHYTGNDKQKWQQGQMAYDIDNFIKLMDKNGLSRDKYTLIKGFYNDSLKPEIIEQHHMRKAALINIDCDLYQSTVEVLQFIKPLLQTGTIIIFDDYFHFNGDRNKGEAKAFREFLDTNKEFTAIDYMQYGWCGKAFIINVDGANDN